MADSKLTGLPEDTTPTSDDWVYSVDLSGAPASKKATAGNVITKAHGLADGVPFIDTGVLGIDSGLSWDNTGKVLVSQNLQVDSTGGSPINFITYASGGLAQNNELAFQNGENDARTSVGILPTGNATSSFVRTYNSSDIANSGSGSLGNRAEYAVLTVSNVGTPANPMKRYGIEIDPSGTQTGETFEVGFNGFFATGSPSTPIYAQSADGGRVGLGAFDWKGTPPTALVHLKASVVGAASLRIPNGTAPTSPNIGDIWSETGLNGELNYRKNASETFDLANQPSKIRYVNSAADLPTAVGGVITLEAGVQYIGSGLSATITLTDELRFSPGTGIDRIGISTNNKITTSATSHGIIVLNSQITYTGSSFLFDSDVGGLSRILNVNIALGTGKGFNITSTTDPNATFILDNVAIVGGADLGSIDGLTLIKRDVRALFFGLGLVLKNLDGLDISALQTVGTNQSTTHLSIEGTSNGLIQMSGFAPTIQSNENGINFDSGTTFNGVVWTDSVPTLAGATKDDILESGSFDQTTIGFKIRDVKGIPDSTITLQGTFSGTSTTVIPVQNAKVFLNTTGWVFQDEERVTGATEGCSTYDGNEEAKISLDGNFELKPNGLNKTMNIGFSVVKEEDRTVTFTNATNLVNETTTPRANGDTITFKNTAGTLPVELLEGVLYYVVSKATDSFQVSYTSGGAAVTFTDDGTPTNSYSVVLLVGGIGRNTPPADSPIDLIPQALADVSTGDEVCTWVSNLSTPVTNISCANAYYRLKI